MKKQTINSLLIFIFFQFLSIIILLFQPNRAFSQAEEKVFKIEELSVEKCLEIADQREKEEQYKEATRFLNRAAYICWDRKELDKALEYYNRSIELNKILNNVQGITGIYSNLGLIYSDKQQYEKALDCFQKTLDGRKGSTDKANQISTLINMSIPLNKLKRHKEAVGRLQVALILAKELNDVNEIKKCFGMLAETYEKSGNADSMMYYFTFYKEFHELSLTEREKKIKTESEKEQLRTLLLESENKNKELELITKNYELNKMNREVLAIDSTARALYDTLTESQMIIELLKKNDKIRELQLTENDIKIQKEQNLRYFLLTCLILLLIIIFLIVRRSIVNKRLNMKLSKQNSEILYQQRRIEDQNSKLEAAYKEIMNDQDKLREYTLRLQEVNATKDKFFSIIAHDLKNPFQSMLGFSELLKTNLKSSDRTKSEHYVNQIYSASKQGYGLLENLLDWARAQTGTIRFNPEKINLKDSISKCLNQTERQAMNKNIRIINEIQEDRYVLTDNNLLMTVFRNLLTNAIKFTPRGGEITIKIADNEKTYEISVIDNGIGIASEDIETIFRVDVKHSTPGTDQEKGTGLGLVLCKEFVKKMGGEIRVQSEKGKGSEFKFTIPVFNNQNG